MTDETQRYRQSHWGNRANPHQSLVDDLGLDALAQEHRESLGVIHSAPYGRTVWGKADDMIADERSQYPSGSAELIEGAQQASRALRMLNESMETISYDWSAHAGRFSRLLDRLSNIQTPTPKLGIRPPACNGCQLFNAAELNCCLHQYGPDNLSQCDDNTRYTANPLCDCD